jgi:hypothetical protein
MLDWSYLISFAGSISLLFTLITIVLFQLLCSFLFQHGREGGLCPSLQTSFHLEILKWVPSPRNRKSASNSVGPDGCVFLFFAKSLNRLNGSSPNFAGSAGDRWPGRISHYSPTAGYTSKDHLGELRSLHNLHRCRRWHQRLSGYGREERRRQRDDGQEVSEQKGGEKAKTGERVASEGSLGLH